MKTDLTEKGDPTRATETRSDPEKVPPRTDTALVIAGGENTEMMHRGEWIWMDIRLIPIPCRDNTSM
ncbi:hypothetical protein EYF80_046975 [Liparis tanakae]|uniref:Uncharacterized protein n=1 Tax=Liparis tanakae TaxID=230148 RepID=A0A4Z2FPM0_9TELE|nr:hypothetical protein EYF80_046975 [Liparis tanakae]